MSGSDRKTAKNDPATGGSTRKSGDQPKSGARPSGSPSKASSSAKSVKPSTTSRLPDKSGSVRPVKKAVDKGHRLATKASTTTGIGKSTAQFPAKPLPTTPGSAPSSAPKKRSYAEIMQRAARLQQEIGPNRSIQHKSMKDAKLEREQMQAQSGGGFKKPSSKKIWRSETRAVSPPTDLVSYIKAAKRSQSLSTDDSRSINSSKALGAKSEGGKDPAKPRAHGAKTKAGKQDAPEPAKRNRFQKTNAATTGYKGTARPPPDQKTPASSKSEEGGSSGTRPVAGAKSAAGGNARPRYGGAALARRPRGRDHDDEMDDFIEYDDDEPQELYGNSRPRYGDSEEDESDMEAGFSDVEDEEHRAAMIARREDQEQEALEQKLKRDKEMRKRQLGLPRR